MEKEKHICNICNQPIENEDEEMKLNPGDYAHKDCFEKWYKDYRYFTNRLNND